MTRASARFRRFARRCPLQGGMAALLMVFAHPVWAACSADYAGLATINELSDKDQFIEVKILSAGIGSDTYSQWELDFCSTDGKNKPTVECSYGVSLADFDAGGLPWLVLDGNDLGNAGVDLAGMDVRLKDSGGATIDYVRVGEGTGSTGIADPACGAAELPYDTRLETVGGQSGQFARRSPDGTGDWSLASGASDGKSTESTTNDGDVAGPLIDIDNVTVFQGESATFTWTLDAAAGVDITVDYATTDATAVAGTDYMAVSGSASIPAGETSGQIVVPTLTSGSEDSRRFYLEISNARDANGDRFGRLRSQLGVGTILPGSTLDGFRVDAPTTASVCTGGRIDISARDGAGNLVTDYDGRIALATSSGRGNWSLNAGQGTLAPDPHTGNDGSASYQFVSADGGTVSLQLVNASADELVVTATDTTQGQSGSSGPIQFLDNAFVIAVTDARGNDFIAERDHALELTAVRRDPVTGDCGPITAYDGAVDLKAWIQRSADDAGGQAPALAAGGGAASMPDAQPAGNNLTVVFSQGVAAMDWQTLDVGQYRLELRDDASGLVVDAAGDPVAVVGSSGQWTVRPERFAIAVPGNPQAADAAGPVFTSAGTGFEVTVTALGAAGNPMLRYGHEGSPQGAQLSHTLEAPATGRLGDLAGTLDIAGGLFTDGEARVTDLSWNEVGIIRLQADNATYLGISPAFTGQSTNVGRFVPADFAVAVDPGRVAAFCSVTMAFAYSGQPLQWELVPRVAISARSAAGDITENYTRGGFLKLIAADIQRTAPTSDTAALNAAGDPYAVTVTLDPGSLNVSGPGELDYDFTSADRLTYAKTPASAVAPFSPDLGFTLEAITDSDTVAAAALPLLFTPEAPLELRYGRLAMTNVYGPEKNITALAMPFRAEFWDGSGFRLHGADGCSAWDTIDIGGTSNHHTLQADAGTLTAGEAGPLLLAPTGSRGTDTLEWAMPVWLRDFWSGGASLEDPSALATFGVYRGHDRVIYWREVQN